LAWRSGGERFLAEGCLSAHYRNMVMEGEEVRAFIEREPGEDHAQDLGNEARWYGGAEGHGVRRP
jgi:hypothetical protein